MYLADMHTHAADSEAKDRSGVWAGVCKSQSLFTQMILHFLFAPLLLAKFFGQRTSIKTNIVPGSLLEFNAPQKTFRWQVARVSLHHPLLPPQRIHRTL